MASTTMMARSSRRPVTVGDGGGTVHLLLPLQARGGQLEGPGDDQGDGKAHRQREHEHPHDPGRRVDVLQHQVDHLQQEPGRDQLGQPDPEDVSSFQFLEERHTAAPGPV